MAIVAGGIGRTDPNPFVFGVNELRGASCFGNICMCTLSLIWPSIQIGSLVQGEGFNGDPFTNVFFGALSCVAAIYLGIVVSEKASKCWQRREYTTIDDPDAVVLSVNKAFESTSRPSTASLG